MDSGGVTREWFSSLSSAASRGSPELFYTAGPQRNQLYVTPTSASPAHLKKFAFVVRMARGCHSLACGVGCGMWECQA